MKRKIIITLLIILLVLAGLSGGYYVGYKKAIYNAKPFVQDGQMYIDFGKFGVHYYE